VQVEIAIGFVLSRGFELELVLWSAVGEAIGFGVFCRFPPLRSPSGKPKIY